MERSDVLPKTQFAYQKCPGTCGAFFFRSHTLQSMLEGGEEAMIMQIDFSVAFDRFCSVGITVFVILTQFLTNRS